MIDEEKDSYDSGESRAQYRIPGEGPNDRCGTGEEGDPSGPAVECVMRIVIY
jgi:hypothetical protein